MLPDRYPTPLTDTAFGDEVKLNNWMVFTRAYARADILYTTDPTSEPTGIRFRLLKQLEDLRVPTPEAIRTREVDTGHDVVAFLSLLEDQASEDLKRHLHYGLTSSDIVDNAHFQALRAHASGMAALTEGLMNLTERWDDSRYPRAGRTHGQIADMTTWNHQMRVQREVLRRIRRELCDYSENVIFKSAGPTGQSEFPLFRASTVAATMNAHVVPSTQVIPRDYQLEWASIYLRLGTAVENLALQIRLGARAEVGEVREGTDRVGSSAMPHKKNPIDSEKVCGLARVMRGHFIAIAEGVALWEDRDLTNSSLERTAVPDLAGTVEYMTRTMNRVMRELVVYRDQMRTNAYTPEVTTNAMQVLAQKHFGMGPVEASKWVRDSLFNWEPRDWPKRMRNVVADYANGQAWLDDVEHYHTQWML